MQIQVDRSHLARALQLVGRAISARTSMPILAHVLVTADKNSLSLAATDLELGIETHITATVREPGGTTLPGRILTDIAVSLPEALVEISTPQDQPRARIVCDQSTFEITGLPAADFPAMDPAGHPSVTLNTELLRSLIRHTVVAVSADETRPFLTGVLVALVENGEAMRFVATDGGRLAVRGARITGASVPAFSAIIPARSLREVGRALGGANGSVDLAVHNNQAVFTLQNTKFISRLLSGQFPAYERAIPSEFTQRVLADTARLLDAVRRARITARDASNVIHLSASNSVLVITSSTPSVGQAREEIAAQAEGESVTAAFNATFVVDALETIETPQVALELTGSLSPAVIRPVGDVDGLHVLAPVRTSA